MRPAQIAKTRKLVGDWEAKLMIRSGTGDTSSIRFRASTSSVPAGVVISGGGDAASRDADATAHGRAIDHANACTITFGDQGIRL